MTRFLIFTAFVLVSVCRVYAQTAIKVTESNTPVLQGVIHYEDVSLNNVTVPKTGNNVKWDYSGLIGDSALRHSYILNIDPGFATTKTTIADTGVSELLTSDNSFKADDIYDEDINGLYLEGSYVKQQKLKLYNYFNDTNDKIIVPEQQVYFRINQVNFPSTAGSAYKLTATRTLHFLWTVDTLKYKNDSSTKVTTYIVSDTVAGWGTLRIPTPTGASSPYRVLLVKRESTAIDSFFVQHKVPKAIYLKAFGLEEGQKSTDYKETFYRAGSANPLMVIDFGKDGSYTSPVSVRYSTDSIKEQSGIEQKDFQPADFVIFPNPAPSGIVNISFTKETSLPWTLILTNAEGKIIISQKIRESGKILMPINLGNAVPGLYFAGVIDENGRRLTSGKLDISR
jgi:hypothetical protein